MADKKLTPVGNISVVTGQYTDKETGEPKNRYLQVGTLFKRNEGRGLVIKLQAMPIGADFDGWMNVYAINRGDNPEGDQSNDQDEITPDNLGEIPF